MELYRKSKVALSCGQVSDSGRCSLFPVLGVNTLQTASLDAISPRILQAALVPKITIKAAVINKMGIQSTSSKGARPRRIPVPPRGRPRCLLLRLEHSNFSGRVIRKRPLNLSSISMLNEHLHLIASQSAKCRWSDTFSPRQPRGLTQDLWHQ